MSRSTISTFQLFAPYWTMKESEETILTVVRAVARGFKYDIGHSDLDDAQPITVTMTLGDYRKACRLLSKSVAR
jgi:hypothetical protein